MGRKTPRKDYIAQCPDLACRRTGRCRRLGDPTLDLAGPIDPEECSPVVVARLRWALEARMAVVEAQRQQ